jgi:hypothetical protein
LLAHEFEGYGSIEWGCDMRFVDEWVMKRAAFGYPPVSLLLLDRPELRSQWNDYSFAITPERVRGSVSRLITNGDVVLYRLSGDVMEELPSDEIADVLRSSSPPEWTGIMLGLTKSGSDLSEAVSGYNWEEYCVIESAGEEREWSILAVSWRTMLRAMRHLISDYNMVSSLSPWQDDISSPWSPTYWKTFAYGFRLRFVAVENVENILTFDEGTISALEEETHLRCDVLQSSYLSWERSAAGYVFKRE